MVGIEIGTSKGLLETLNPWLGDWREFLQRASKPVFRPNVHQRPKDHNYVPLWLETLPFTDGLASHNVGVGVPHGSLQVDSSKNVLRNACWRKWIFWPSSKIVGPSVCGDSIILRASPPTCLSYSQVDLSKNGSATLASSSHCISQSWSTGLLWSFWCLNVFILKIDRFCPTWLSSSTLREAIM